MLTVFLSDGPVSSQEAGGGIPESPLDSSTHHSKETELDSASPDGQIQPPESQV